MRFLDSKIHIFINNVNAINISIFQMVEIGFSFFLSLSRWPFNFIRRDEKSLKKGISLRTLFIQLEASGKKSKSRSYNLNYRAQIRMKAIFDLCVRFRSIKIINSIRSIHST